MHFPSARELRKHFNRHKDECGVATEAAYLAMAEAFSVDPCPADRQECVRARDAKLARFRPADSHFCVRMPDRVTILTYHVLIPSGTIGAIRPHAFASNEAYVADDCARTA